MSSVNNESEGLGEGAPFSVNFSEKPNLKLGKKSDLNQTKKTDSSKLRVLVVDDNQDAAINLSLLIETLGYDTYTVHDGLGALGAAIVYSPDVVFLDIGLPDISGYEVASVIRQQSLSKPIKLYALTGLSQAEDKRKSRASGFDKHIVKPLDFAVLSKLLENIHTDITN